MTFDSKDFLANIWDMLYGESKYPPGTPHDLGVIRLLF